MMTKTCFVIAPIGDVGSRTRRRSDRVLKEIITPAVRQRGYDPVRADHIAKPGVITDQVIQHVVDDPLVVADLTDGNPNVFYELALRHAVQKPLVQLIEKGQRIPFDIRPMRTITLDHRNQKSVSEAKKEIVRQIDAAQEFGDVETPISQALYRHVGGLMLSGWRGHKHLDDLVPRGTRRAVIVGQNLAGRLGFNKAQRKTFAAELRVLLERGTGVTLVIMPPSVLKAVHLEAAEDLERFTLPGLKALATALGPLADRVRVLFHPAATLSLLAVDETYGYVEPKFQRTEQMSSRLTVKLGPKLFDQPSLERMLYHGEKRDHGALLVGLGDAAEELHSQLVASGIVKKRSNKALQPTSRKARRPKSKRAKPARG